MIDENRDGIERITKLIKQGSVKRLSFGTYQDYLGRWSYKNFTVCNDNDCEIISVNEGIKSFSKRADIMFCPHGISTFEKE